MLTRWLACVLQVAYDTTGKGRAQTPPFGHPSLTIEPPPRQLQRLRADSVDSLASSGSESSSSDCDEIVAITGGAGASASSSAAGAGAGDVKVESKGERKGAAGSGSTGAGDAKQSQSSAGGSGSDGGDPSASSAVVVVSKARRRAALQEIWASVSRLLMRSRSMRCCRWMLPSSAMNSADGRCCVSLLAVSRAPVRGAASRSPASRRRSRAARVALEASRHGICWRCCRGSGRAGRTAARVGQGQGTGRCCCRCCCGCCGRGCAPCDLAAARAHGSHCGLRYVTFSSPCLCLLFCLPAFSRILCVVEVAL